jgi:hypothetical protein
MFQKYLALDSYYTFDFEDYFASTSLVLHVCQLITTDLSLYKV